MLYQVRVLFIAPWSGYTCHISYDLALDQKLAEETTVLVESYTVREYVQIFERSSSIPSSLMGGQSKWARSGLKLQSACSNHT